VGGKYKLRILWVLSKGSKRYGEIQRSLVLACQGKPVTARVEYTLTPAGATVGPVVDPRRSKYQDAGCRQRRLIESFGIYRRLSPPSAIVCRQI
jgi:DNA-binding HxlR family transcriptional regulator